MNQYNIYKTKNLINGKYYWGIHNSIDESDGYLGSGVALNNAIKKYGKNNFVRETKLLYDTAKEAFEDERFIVNREMINRKDCYNEKIGGYGGFSHIDNSGEKNPMFGKGHLRLGKNNPNFGNIGEKNPNFGIKRPNRSSKLIGNKNALGFVHSEEWKKEKSKECKGQNNPMSKTNVERRKNELWR